MCDASVARLGSTARWWTRDAWWGSPACAGGGSEGARTPGTTPPGFGLGGANRRTGGTRTKSGAAPDRRRGIRSSVRTTGKAARPGREVGGWLTPVGGWQGEGCARGRVGRRARRGACGSPGGRRGCRACGTRGTPRSRRGPGAPAPTAASRPPRLVCVSSKHSHVNFGPIKLTLTLCFSYKYWHFWWKVLLEPFKKELKA